MEIEVALQVVLFKEGEQFIAYCPALELSSYGASKDEARSAFEEATEIFFEETERKGTLEKVLLQLGWILKKKPKPSYQPPPFPSKGHFSKKPSYKERVAIPV